MIDELKNYKIAVLAGGPSSEREISLKSGKAVHDALSSAGIENYFIDVRGERDFISGLERTRIDLAFIALHGRFGEDGTLQRLLDGEGVKYTGSGPEASRRAMDKIASKTCFDENGISTPEYAVLNAGSKLDVDNIWFPCVIKPGEEGSSIGLTVVDAPDKAREAFRAALRYSDRVLVEKFIEGREMTVGILDDEPLPVVEIVAGGGVYDFEAKYSSSTTKYLAPAPIDDKLRKKAVETGLAAHRAIGCAGFSRVDLRVGADGVIYVLEVNTIPGLTERSLLPMAAKAAGMSFEDLCIKILYSALRVKR
ncbi:MAG: D-alanine--D-alanine ligase [Candidatus Omnitrophica bacterium]|nr:D-alanine--D-alanine ligase [Candidatus Omnitrophota bacterium]